MAAVNPAGSKRKPAPKRPVPATTRNLVPSGPGQVYLVAALLATAALAVFSNCFAAPFNFDDFEAVTDNPSIRHLWPIGAVLQPPGDLTVGGRPILNLSFALNYAVSGRQVWSYHAFNLLVHILAGLTLFGVVRRTLLLPSIDKTFHAGATPIAAAASLLWLVHPLQTESVTYISQRAESMMGLFYLLTLYGFIRAATTESKQARVWSVVSVAACVFGMATKEVTATAPLVALLYDRTFLASTFREAWRRRWRLFVILAASWLMLLYSLSSMGQRAVGLHLGVSPWNYLLTECDAISLYVTLIFWPHPQHLDYGLDMANSPMQVLPQGLFVLFLLAATAVALVRWPRLGFAGAWFFLILAPTSSIIPVAVSPIAEHRVYLPLAAPLVLAVLALYRLGGTSGLLAVLPVAVVWAILAFLRNNDYLSPVDLWKDAIDLRPDNERAHTNYGVALLDHGDPADAVQHLEIALQLCPTYPGGKDNLAKAENNWGNMLVDSGRYAEAIPHFQRALGIKPGLAETQYNWGNALYYQGRYNEAIGHYQASVQNDPTEAEANNNWGLTLLKLGRPADAIARFQEALRINPALAEAQFNWGRALMMTGNRSEAIFHFQETLRADPSFPTVRDILAQLNASAP